MKLKPALILLSLLTLLVLVGSRTEATSSEGGVEPVLEYRLYFPLYFHCGVSNIHESDFRQEDDCYQDKEK